MWPNVQRCGLGGKYREERISLETYLYPKRYSLASECIRRASATWGRNVSGAILSGEEADGWRVNADSVRRLLDSLLRGTFANEFAIFLDLSSQLVKGLSRGCCDRVLIGCGDPSD